MVVNVRRRSGSSARDHRRNVKIFGKYRVLADGVEIPEVFYYDGRRRIIKANKLNEAGKAYLIGNEVATVTIKPRRVKLLRKAS